MKHHVFTKYQEYLLSDHWNKIKSRKRHRCSITNRAANTEFHHLSYKTLGHEVVWRDLREISPFFHRRCHYWLDLKSQKPVFSSQFDIIN